MKIDKLVPGELYRRTRKDILISRFGWRDVNINSVIEFVQKTIGGAEFLASRKKIELTREQVETEVSEYNDGR